MYVVMSSAHCENSMLLEKQPYCLSSSATEKCCQVSFAATFSYSPTLEAEVLD